MQTILSSHERYCSGAAPEVGYFRSGGSQLSYSCVIPPNKGKRPGIIFVHAADGNRLGPHRMFVELANCFNRLGYPTLRFDLGGCGDSTGDASDGDIGAEVSDLLAAIRFFTAKAELEHVILLGISRGAFVCHTAMVQHDLPLSGVILLSSPVSSGRAALKSFGGGLKEYLYKLRDPKCLWRLLSGRANISQIRQTLVKSLKLSQRYRSSEKKGFASRCPVLFIYGGNDAIRDESSRHYTSRCRENGLPYECHFVANANHSFFHYRWKEQILALVQQWLEETQIRATK